MPRQEPTATWFERHKVVTLGAIVLAITLAIDCGAAAIFLPKDYNAYRVPNPWFHHGFTPRQSSKESWAYQSLNIYTNSLGFKDRAPREVALSSANKRVLLLGDSFTEGVAIPYQDTFAGLLETRLEDSGVEVLNAAVSSYSTKLYYLKTRYLLEEAGLEFDEMCLFIDISDPIDDLVYEDFQANAIPWSKWGGYRVRRFLEHNSYLCAWIRRLSLDKEKSYLEYDRGIFPGMQKGYTLAEQPEFSTMRWAWSLDDERFEHFREPAIRGLELAKENIRALKQVLDRYDIRLTIAVYPWPQNILLRQVDTIQTRTWRDFCVSNNIDFMNLYPLFITGEDPEIIISRFFIPQDVHWNERGHQQIANALYAKLNSR